MPRAFVSQAFAPRLGSVPQAKALSAILQNRAVVCGWRFSMKKLAVIAIVLLCALGLAAAGAGAGGFQILKKIPVAVHGGWGFLFAPDHPVYIPPTRHVPVLNL